MEFSVLGRLSVTDDAGQPVYIGSAYKPRLLLALVLSRPGRVLPVDWLVDAMWADTPPRSARRNVYQYAQRLRSVLSPARFRSAEGGYVLQPQGHDVVDAVRFQAILDDAGQTEDPGRVRPLLEEALALWRDSPLVEFGECEPLAHYAADLQQRWLNAQHRWARASIAVGCQERVVECLTPVVAAHPFREDLCADLMLALYQIGRQTDALDLYRRGRRLLVAELGVEPSGELQRLHSAILNGDPALIPANGARRAAAVPRCLPHDVPDFTGRADCLAWLDEGAAVSVLSGIAGVGKSALAVRWSRRSADRFPDGQLYVNLRGYSPEPPMTPLDALTHLLRLLGIAPDAIPNEQHQAEAVYRSTLADKKMLILLDNAGSAEQVRPLLPNGPGNLVVVTSRDKLGGLIAHDGARRLLVDLLTADEAHRLLEAILGPVRINTEPDAVGDLIASCGRLPLALRVAAANLLDQPHRTVADYLQQLQADRLAVLHVSGDPGNGVTAIFEHSYRNLTADQRQLFRLLGIAPGNDLALDTIAALAQRPPTETRSLLDQLAAMHLVSEHTPNRYSLHDLLRDYAHQLAHADERRTALGCVLDHCLHTAHAAAQLLNPRRDQVEPPGAAPAGTRLADHDAAMVWLTDEYSTLRDAITLAAAGGFDTHAAQLTWALTTYFQRNGRWQDWLDTARLALDACSRQGDLAGQILSHRGIARAHARLGHHDDAHRHFRRALAIAEQAGDLTAQAHTQLNIATMLSTRNRYADALPHAVRSLELHQATGHEPGQANALNAVGWCHAHLGDYRRANDACRDALRQLQRIGDRVGEAASWDSLGYIHHRAGNFPEATNCYQRSLDQYRQLGDRHNEAVTLINLGDNHHASAEPEAAHQAWSQAHAILRDLGHPDAELRSAGRVDGEFAGGAAG